MVTSVDDILEELSYVRTNVDSTELEPKKSVETPAPLPQDLSELEQSALGCFAGGDVISQDALAERLGHPVAELSAALVGLELKRLIIKRADGRFEAK